MNKAQLQAGLSFNSETLSKAENTPAPHARTTRSVHFSPVPDEFLNSLTMTHKIASLNIVAARELDPITAIAINTRFECFFVRFCEAEGIDIEKALNTARAILEAAEIPQGKL